MRRTDDDERIGAVAGRQYAVIAARQAVALGVPRRSFERRAWLHRIHTGVYATVPPERLTMQGRYLAAALYAGDAAAVSHRSAAALWALAPGQPEWIEVSTPRRRTGCAGVRVRDRRGFRRTVLDGIPVTTPAQTILDLAERGTDRGLEKALAAAYEHRLLTPEEHAWLLGPHRGRPGAGRLRRFAAGAPTATTTESPLEEAFVALLDRYGIPRPETNAWLTLPGGGSIRIDALWRRERVAVELDGSHHLDARRHAADAERDARLQALGFAALRFTHAQVHGRPALVRDLLLGALRRPSGC